MAAGRLVLLAVSPRVAPGLLTWRAWQLLRGAHRVVVTDPDHRQLTALRAAGVTAVELRGAEPAALAAELAALAGSTVTGPVVLLERDDGEPALRAALAAWTHDACEPPLDTEVVSGSWDLPGARLLDLVAVMDRLRSPGGCPWDARQTHVSLVPYLVEEAFETVEAIETGDRPGLREELGDLLLQVVFHARIAAEDPDEPWTVDDVATGIVDKLVRRHPHVFTAAGGGPGPTLEELDSSWAALKKAEKGRSSSLDGVPMGLPALALAAALLERAARGGALVPLPALEQGLAPVTELLEPAGQTALGDALLAVVDRARAAGLDAEAALRGAARRYAERVRSAEARARGTDLHPGAPAADTSV